jgi:Ca2+-binding RTX toxin-like protein
VARPFWFRLFGRNSGYTNEEITQALEDSSLGDRLANSNFLKLIFRISDRSDTLSGGTHAPTPALTPRELALTPRADAVSTTGGEAAVVAAAALSGAGAQAPAPAAIDTLSDTPSDEDASAALDGTDGRSATVMLDGVSQSLLHTAPVSPFALGARDFIVIYTDDLQSGMVVDAHTKQILPGSPSDYPELGAGTDDALELNGDYSSGVELTVPGYVDTIIARPGHDYNLIASDDDVAAGATLAIDAMPLADTGRMIFDGSAETDGRFVFYGSELGDVFFGGAGDDRMLGLGGADILSGGGGSDTFVYNGAGQSSGPGYDTLADFQAGVDHIDLLGAVSGFGAAIAGGTLSFGSFNDDLDAVLGGLGPSQAVWFAPDAGDLAGQIFLIVDANGIAGYQEGEDYVFAVAGSSLADLTGHTDIFI